MFPVKQSTALTVVFFAYDVAGDAVTGLTDVSFTKRISKGSGAFAAMTVTITEMENGMYSFPLSATHSDTLGILTIIFTNAGAKQVNLQFRIFAKLIDDLNDVADTDIVSAGAITTLAGAIVNVDLVDTVTTNTDMRGTDSAALASVATEARLAELDAANLPADIDAILNDTGTGGVVLTAAERLAVADAILARDIGSGTGAGTLDERTVRSALRFLRNKFDVVAGTLTVKKEDDTATAWTAAMTTDAAANPIIGSDPT